MNTQALTQVEFRGDDFAIAEAMAKRLGYTQTAYTSTSALWGLFCLADSAHHQPGCIIKTQELGFLFVQDVEDLHIPQDWLDRFVDDRHLLDGVERSR